MEEKLVCGIYKWVYALDGKVLLDVYDQFKGTIREELYRGTALPIREVYVGNIIGVKLIKSVDTDDLVSWTRDIDKANEFVERHLESTPNSEIDSTVGVILKIDKLDNCLDIENLDYDREELFEGDESWSVSLDEQEVVRKYSLGIKYTIIDIEIDEKKITIVTLGKCGV